MAKPQSPQPRKLRSRIQRKLRLKQHHFVHCKPKETLFSGIDEHLAALINDIDHATHCIDLETYIFSRDPVGQRIANALIAAAKRGLKVRVLVDGAGSPLWTTSFARALEDAGAQTKVFHPFPWQLWNFSRSVIKLPFILKWIYLILKINSRNHRKVCIIDNKIAYIGSFNLMDKDWRDISVRLSQVNLGELQKAFNSAWNHHTIRERLRDVFHHVRQDPNIRMNYTWLRRRVLYKNLLRKISQCKDRIWITNAYFVPDNVLLKRLKDAASKGVDVRILLPRKADVMMMPWASSTFYYTLLKKGARIFEYLPTMLHAKSIILDDWALIGSSNLNHRSLLHDLEADIKLVTEKSREKLEQLFIDDLKNARELSLKSWKSHRPWRHRALGRLVLYLKYWI